VRLLVGLDVELARAAVRLAPDDWLLLPEPWYRGRVVLIGDAAHATTAHLASGGGMAIEDAVVLGQEVAAGGAVHETLQRFMARRFERVRLVVDTSVELGRMMGRGDPVPAQNALRGTAMAALASPY
jgi:2-polyprenyl-6-methoxyphenol hydroxylase-like FAD-dependent oxidoreductase